MRGRVVADGEPLFLPEDWEIALELQVEEDLACPGCGHPRDESMDPANDGGPKSRAHYEPHRAVCLSCAERQRADKALAESAGDDLMGSYSWTELVFSDRDE